MKTTIKTHDYYGVPSYYSVMPQAIFDALEQSVQNGEELTTVDKKMFDKMIADHTQKMSNLVSR